MSLLSSWSQRAARCLNLIIFLSLEKIFILATNYYILNHVFAKYTIYILLQDYAKNYGFSLSKQVHFSILINILYFKITSRASEK